MLDHIKIQQTPKLENIKVLSLRHFKYPINLFLSQRENKITDAKFGENKN